MARAEVILKLGPGEFRTVGAALRAMCILSDHAKSDPSRSVLSPEGARKVLKDLGAGNPETARASAQHLIETLNA